ncbi:MAG: diadenylate cyclase CdaA [Mangrovibacterium sp.]
MNAFITIRFLDILDVLMVAYLLYQLYQLIRGTVALNIFIGLSVVYLFWLLVRALNMELIGTLVGQFIGVGVLALIVVFQQEIRRFLLMIGSSEQVNRFLRTDRLFSSDRQKSATSQQVKLIVKACENMARTCTGALIIMARKSELREYVRTGERLNARISDALLETIFFKNTPLHDGAVIIVGNRIVAARCILPVTDKRDLDPSLGLRHRAAIGITEATDALAIVVSEEKGRISFVRSGRIQQNISLAELTKLLSHFIQEEADYAGMEN